MYQLEINKTELGSMTTMVDQTHRWDYAECPSWRPSTARWVLLPGQYVSIWLSENMRVCLCMYSMQAFCFSFLVLAPYQLPIVIVGLWTSPRRCSGNPKRKRRRERKREREKRSRTTMERIISRIQNVEDQP